LKKFRRELELFFTSLRKLRIKNGTVSPLEEIFRGEI
jgi:hypothetical protein